MQGLDNDTPLHDSSINGHKKVSKTSTSSLRRTRKNRHWQGGSLKDSDNKDLVEVKISLASVHSVKLGLVDETLIRVFVATTVIGPSMKNLA